MRRSWTLFAIWLGVSVIAVLACSVNLSAAKLHGEYVPVGNDSFYHARRILDTARDPASFYEFDSRIHAPEGSLLAWPWGYDYALGWIVRAGVSVGLSADPMQILAWIPVAAVPIAVALMLAIAAGLGLSNWLVVLSGLCFALVPTTQLLHGVGEIDHHYAEMMFMLGALAFGLALFRKPQSRAAAIALAAVLGIAPAIHNGLFILQIPFLATVFIRWLQGRFLPTRTAASFALLLTAATLGILLPSLPFRMGRFEFYTLSWFHLYIAACTALLTVLMAYLKPARSGAFALAAVSAAMLIPLISQLGLAELFLSGAHKHLEVIGEMQSPARLALKKGTIFITRIYSYLILLAPVTLVVCAVQCWRERTSERLLFWVASTMGLCLLSLQLRLHYFGDFALYMPWLVLAHDFATRRPELRKKVYLIVTLVMILLYAPVLRYQLLAPMPVSNDPSFENIRPIFRTLHEACAAEPGIVLADNNAGHFIRYYTDCSVIADNFLLTPQHMQKTDEVQYLFSLSAAELARTAPHVRYVLIRPIALRRSTNGGFAYGFFYAGQEHLAADLLFQPSSAVPANYTLLQEIRFKEVDNAVYARLYRIGPVAGGARGSSASPNDSAE